MNEIIQHRYVVYLVDGRSFPIDAWSRRDAARRVREIILGRGVIAEITEV